MNPPTSRRFFAALLPALAAASRLRGQDNDKRLPSKIYLFDNLPSKKSDVSSSHAVFDGVNHAGFPIEVHITELNPGASPHAPHKHVNEEMFFLKSGVVEVTIEGQTSRLTPGSIGYVNSNELHGIHNPGPDPAVYCVVAFGPKS